MVANAKREQNCCNCTCQCDRLWSLNNLNIRPNYPLRIILASFPSEMIIISIKDLRQDILSMHMNLKIKDKMHAEN